MYVIFPADEVVYLSYGRLIYVPTHPNPEGETHPPIRTNSLCNTLPEGDCNVANISQKQKKLGSEPEQVRHPIPGTSRQIDPPVLDCPPSNGAGLSAKPNPKKKLLRLNFNLLKKNSSKTTDTPFSPRLRKSIGHSEKINLTSPEEAFRNFCVIDSNKRQETSFSGNSLPTEKGNTDTNLGQGNVPSIESKRSSLSSKTGKQDKDSKRSSKHSTSSSKSGKTDKNSPQTPNSTKKHLKKAQSLIEELPIKNRKVSTGSAPTNEEQFYPLGTNNRRTVINSENSGNSPSSRKISTSSSPINDEVFYPLGTSRRSIVGSENKQESSNSSNTFIFNLRRRSKSKTPEPKSYRPESDSQGFYPLSTSREKSLEETKAEDPKRSRKSPFRLSFRRSKTPEVPSRPERKKDKKEIQSTFAKPKTLDRKLSFSDYLAVSHDKVESKSQVLVLPPSGREKVKSKSPVLGLSTKSPVLNFFKKTPANPRSLGRDRTPGILHTSDTPFFPPDPSTSNFSTYNSVHNSLEIEHFSANTRSRPPTPTGLQKDRNPRNQRR